MVKAHVAKCTWAAYADHTFTKGHLMTYLLFLLIPIVALLVWAAKLNRNRRRRGHPVHDIGAAARATRLDAERRGEEWRAGA